MATFRRLRIAGLTAAVSLPGSFSATALADLTFTEQAAAVGASYSHDVVGGISEIDETEAGGVAAGDIDNDGDTDLYIVTGNSYDNVLLRNNGDSPRTFTNITAGSGVALTGHWGSGPVFGDINGDGFVDLLVGGMQGSGYYVFTNDQDSTFTNVSAASNVIQSTGGQNDLSSALGDADNDGDLDLFVGHHRFLSETARNHLWKNNGSGVFTASDTSAGVTFWGTNDLSFAATFVDIDSDGWQDLLITSDGNTSQTYENDGDGTFTRTTVAGINDQFGMGSAPADYDNDGDIDWFVTSIHDPNGNGQTGRTGNRLYRNDGSGGFTDISTSAGVRHGWWGWGACAADFDNDGWLDIFHVNGFHNVNGIGNDYVNDPARLFMNDGAGTTFTESAAATNLVETNQGRGVVCFDYDDDGDIDLFVMNTGGLSKLWRNELTENPGWLQVDVVPESNAMTIAGTVIKITIGAVTQTRQIAFGSNFESQNPTRQHFGLGGVATVDEVRVRWPSGYEVVMTNVAANQILVVPMALFRDSFE